MPGHTIPSEYSRVRNPGVPTKARIEDLAETPKEPVVYKEFFIAPNSGKTAATLLPRAQVYPEGGTGVMKLATARPKPFDPAKMWDHTDPVLTPAGIVANLGMGLATEQAWTKFLSDETGKAVNEVAFRKVVMEHAIEEKLDRVVRRAILQRALMYWRGRHVEKALYIGPRGGKWADARHTIPWDQKRHAPGRKIHVVDATTGAKPAAPKGQIGLFDRPPTKVLGEEGAAGTKEPVKPSPLPVPTPALTIPKPEKKRRELAVEVGEHVWGSRADRAVRSADDLKELSPEDQAKYATKKNLMPVPSVDELLEANFTPSAIVMRRAIESCVQSKAPNSLLERQDFMNGVDYLARTLDACRTGQDVEDFLHDWMNLAVGKKRDKSYSAKDMEAMRQEYLAEHGIKQTRTRDELRALTAEQHEVWNKIRDAQIVKMPKTHKEYMGLAKRGKELSEQIVIAEKAFPQPHSLLKWKINAPRYSGLSLEFGADDSITTYLDAPELAVGDNAYDSMAKALGPRMVNLVATGGTYKTWKKRGQTPKVYTDARRLARDMQGESAEKQLEMLRAVTGGKGTKPRIKRAPYRWERKVPGEIDRVGGRPVTTADPSALAKDFGFKNVQFGNWVTEDDADTHLRGAHGALFDLADVLGVDPKAVGLNGRLALGFGARGSGSASAHYESGKKIINLTKIAGGGSLAHEWAHALDNIISVASDPEATEAGMYLTGGKVAGADRSVVDALDGVMAAMRWGGDAEVMKMEQRGQELLARRSRKERLSYTERRNIKSYQAAMAGKHRAVTRSKYLEDAQAIGGTGRNAYWTRPHEMFARAFEAYVEDALEDDGRRSSYLVSGTRAGYVSGRMVEGREAQPYPQGAERTAINAAMAKLVKAVVDTKSLEKALRVLDGMRYVVDLEKAGPYIGPRGGKWADPEHTISWREFKRIGKAKFGTEMDKRRSGGMTVTGPKTFKYKEIIKAAGGIWDSWEKQWLVPSMEIKNKLDAYMARGGKITGPAVATPAAPTPPVKPVEAVSVPDAGILSEAQARHEMEGQKPPTEADIKRFVEAIRSVTITVGYLPAELGLGGIQYGGKLSDHGKEEVAKLTKTEVAILTDACRGMVAREPIRRIKAAQERDREESERMQEQELQEKKDLAAGKLKTAQGQGYGGQPFLKGETFSHPRQGLVTVVKSGQRYIREEGMSFGVGDEAGYIYWAECRSANHDEIAKHEARRAKKEAAKQRSKRIAQISRTIIDDGEFPKGSHLPKGERLFGAPTPYGGGSWFVLEPDGETVWHVRNNGADGDCWANNNVGTGGAGALGWRLKSKDLADELKKLASTKEQA